MMMHANDLICMSRLFSALAQQFICSVRFGENKNNFCLPVQPFLCLSEKHNYHVG